jgi:hypothetical protein
MESEVLVIIDCHHILQQPTKQLTQAAFSARAFAIKSQLSFGALQPSVGAIAQHSLGCGLGGKCSKLGIHLVQLGRKVSGFAVGVNPKLVIA